MFNFLPGAVNPPWAGSGRTSGQPWHARMIHTAPCRNTRRSAPRHGRASLLSLLHGHVIEYRDILKILCRLVLGDCTQSSSCTWMDTTGQNSIQSWTLLYDMARCAQRYNISSRPCNKTLNSIWAISPSAISSSVLLDPGFYVVPYPTEPAYGEAEARRCFPGWLFAACKGPVPSFLAFGGAVTAFESNRKLSLVLLATY